MRISFCFLELVCHFVLCWMVIMIFVSAAVAVFIILNHRAWGRSIRAKPPDIKATCGD
ncbi:hypothetical protein DSUL_130006 [Desulfovibrionales bacterium]